MFKVKCGNRLAVVMPALTGENGFFDMVVSVDQNTYPKTRITAWECANEIVLMVGTPVGLSTRQLEAMITEGAQR